MRHRYESKKDALLICSNTRITTALVANVRNAIAVNRKYFGTTPRSISVLVCNNASSWKRESREYYFPFARGLVLRDGKMVIKDRKFSGLNAVQHRKLIMHEMNHLFWLQHMGRGRSMWSPIWLVEALACDVARGEYLVSAAALKKLCRGREKERLLSHRYRNADIISREELIFRYSLWFHLLQFIKKQRGFSLQGLLKALKRSRSKSAVDQWFLKSLGATPDAILTRLIQTR